MTGHPIPFKVQLTPNWAITLNEQFVQKQQEKSLNLYNERLSLWIRAYYPTPDMSILARMDRDAELATENAFDHTREIADGVGKITFCIPADPTSSPPKPDIFHTYSHASESELILAMMYADEVALKAAKAIYASLEYTETE